ncbi:MAG: RNase H family protein [Candidatus Binatia bacterium]
MSADALEILAFTDGAAKGNPGPGGWGTVMLIGGAAVRELGGAGGATTNNRMEMMAAAAALEWLVETQHGEPASVTVVTDSTYVLKGATQWLGNWKRRGWKTAADGEVANRDLWERLDKAIAASGRLRWRHVPGHAGFAGNERADEIASDFASGRRPVLYSGPYDGYGRDLHHLPDAGAPIRSVSKAAKGRAKGAAHSYVSVVDGVVLRHSTWAECERRVKGRPGALFRKTASAADESALVREWGGRLDDPGSGR